jgi:hypothetical protein
MVKMFATLDENNIVVDLCVAESFEKAQEMQPQKTHIEMTLDNSPATIGYYYDGSLFKELK